MFKLNFKEKIADVVIDKVVNEVRDEVRNRVFPNYKSEPLTETPLVDDQYLDSEVIYNNTPLQTDKYEELINVVNDISKKRIYKQKQQGKNLFSTPSVITILVFLCTAILTDVDQALVDSNISTREWIQIAITFAGAIGTVVARGSEGTTGVYTPHGIPGMNREDYDNDGIPDDEDDTPWGI